MRSPSVMEGFWLPKALRERVCTTGTSWEQLAFAGGRECGRECAADEPGAVAARWPLLGQEEWTVLFEGLACARRDAPRGKQFWERLQAALRLVSTNLAGRGGSACAGAGQAAATTQEAGAGQAAATMQAISCYTGYSPAMVGSVMSMPDLWDLGQMAAAFTASPTRASLHMWEPLPGLPGRVHFTPSAPCLLEPRSWLFGGPAAKILSRMTPVARRPLFGEPEPVGAVVGYGAGNVPGTALIIVLLSLSTSLVGGAPPVVVVRNSRREPIFSPLVLRALEEVDAALVSTVAVLVWDYEDPELQHRLLGSADLVIAAAGDDTIARLGAQIAAAGGRPGASRPLRQAAPRSQDLPPEPSKSLPSPTLPPGSSWAPSSPTLPPNPSRTMTPVRSRVGPRFHAHGHKVSFSAIGREMLAGDRQDPLLSEGEDLLDAVALLAALDSVFWDQNGCLSSRVHFVETGGPGDRTPFEYAECLVHQLRRLSQALPRGAWPLRQLHDTFDRYTALEASGRPEGRLRVVSRYEDPFVVVLDEREAGTSARHRQTFGTLVNECQGRVVVVRPVARLMDVPERYLGMLPARSLQSLSVAVGRQGEGLTPEFLEFAAACSARGVTAIRVVGRAAFPQLAYSWDGLLPLDLISQRPEGRFTTIEFDRPFEDMIQAYRVVSGRLIGSRTQPYGPGGD